jgi:hypothetical protein
MHHLKLGLLLGQVLRRLHNNLLIVVHAESGDGAPQTFKKYLNWRGSMCVLDVKFCEFGNLYRYLEPVWFAGICIHVKTHVRSDWVVSRRGVAAEFALGLFSSARLFQRVFGMH